MIFTLDGADHAYRTLVETMNEGTATLSFDGTLLYCNRHFAALLNIPLQALVGTSIYRFIAPDSEITFKAILEQGMDRGRSISWLMVEYLCLSCLSVPCRQRNLQMLGALGHRSERAEEK